MAERKSQKLDVVKKLAEQKESKAASLLQEQQEKLASENEFLSQLSEYYDSYLSDIDQQLQVSPEELLRYRGFSQQLAKSVKQIEQKISHTEQAVQFAREEWAQLRHKRSAIEDLIESAIQEERAEDDRIEQKYLDELVGQRFYTTHQAKKH
ncbi:flagellar export protein FliJ [Aurantivibrio plasticivorans]